MALGRQFPRLDTPFVNPDLTIAYPWQRLLQELWAASGGSQPVQDLIILVYNSTTGQIDVTVASTGMVLGQLQFSNLPGGNAQVQVPGVSPFTFIAGTSGFMVVYAAAVEISRDNGLNWYKASEMGGAFPLALADRLRATWYGGTDPEITFFPSA